MSSLRVAIWSSFCFNAFGLAFNLASWNALSFMGIVHLFLIVLTIAVHRSQQRRVRELTEVRDNLRCISERFTMASRDVLASDDK